MATKRELSTLLQKLFSLKQSHKTVANFYTAINDCYTGISTHIQMDPQWVHPDELVKFVDKLCLEKFIDGLEEPYSSHVGLLQPSNLSQAFQYASDKMTKIIIELKEDSLKGLFGTMSNEQNRLRSRAKVRIKKQIKSVVS